jgi:hypothetical protein
MGDMRAVGQLEIDRLNSNVRGDVAAGPDARDRVDRALDLGERPPRGTDVHNPSGTEASLGYWKHMASVLLETDQDVALRRLLVEPRHQFTADALEVGSRRDRHQVLPADPLAARFHPALVVACLRPRKAGFEQIVVGQGAEPRVELAL